MIRKLVQVRQNLVKQTTLFRNSQNVAKVQTSSVQKLSVEEENDTRDKALLAQEYSQILREDSKFYFLPWVNNKKTVFEAEILHHHVYRYYLLGGVLGGLFLFMLYQGDAKYKYILSVPLVAAFLLYTGKRNQIRNSLSYLQEIQLHKDGKVADFVVFKNQKFETLKNVGVNQFKLCQSDPVIKLDLTIKQKLLFKQDKLNLSFSVLRKSGFVINDMVTSIEGQYYFMPLNYNGNQFALQSLFNGQEVNTELI